MKAKKVKKSSDNFRYLGGFYKCVDSRGEEFLSAKIPYETLKQCVMWARDKSEQGVSTLYLEIRDNPAPDNWTRQKDGSKIKKCPETGCVLKVGKDGKTVRLPAFSMKIKPGIVWKPKTLEQHNKANARAAKKKKERENDAKKDSGRD